MWSNSKQFDILTLKQGGWCLLSLWHRFFNKSKLISEWPYMCTVGEFGDKTSKIGHNKILDGDHVSFILFVSTLS